MFSDLSDFSLVFIAIAIFGYMISDTFKRSRYYGIPDTSKSNIERFFRHISNGLMALSFLISFTFLILAAPNKENFITKFLLEFVNVFEKLHETGIISDYYYTSILRTFALSFLPAVAFLTILSLTALLGFFLKFSQEIGVRVFLKGKEQPIEALDLISESDQFFYISKQGMLWAAIRKENVERIETIRTLSLLQKSLIVILEHIKTWRDIIQQKIHT